MCAYIKMDYVNWIFCRTRRKEKLKIICQNFIRNLGNECEVKTTDGTSTSRGNIIEYAEEPKEEDSQEDIKDIGGYLLPKAISNAKTLGMQVDNNEPDDGEIMNDADSVPYHYATDNLDDLHHIYAIPVKELNNNIKTDQTVGVSRNSSMLSREFRLQSDKIEYTFNTSLQESQFFHLKEEIDYESQRIKEISKLFDTFKENVEFYGCPAHLEAEKLMLYGCYRRNYLIECIRDNHYEDTSRNPAIVGSMSLSDLRVPLSRMPSSNQFSEWFVCIVSCSSEIFVSRPVRSELNWLHFDDNFHFDNIRWDSVINFSIYSMRVPKLGTLKKLLNKNIDKRQSKKLLYKDLRTYDMIECKVNNSMFKLCATARLYAQDRARTEIRLDVSELYDLEDKLFARIESGKLRYTNNHCGFLTVGDADGNGGFAWSRKWCAMNGCTFQYWNYPNDEAFKEPRFKIDLRETVRVKLADRSKCPKPRTFIVETKNGDDENGGRAFYFSADTQTDLGTWTNALKEIVACLKGWNII